MHYIPEPEEELFAQLLIRRLFNHEQRYRFFLPYDRALVKSVAPHALRLAFHMNMEKSDGCVDMTNPFSNGLQNFTKKVEQNHILSKKLFKFMRAINLIETSGQINGQNIDPEISEYHENMFKLSERECNRKMDSANYKWEGEN